MLTKCAQFDLTQAPANESDLIYVRHTSYCFTEVFIATDRAEGWLSNVNNLLWMTLNYFKMKNEIVYRNYKILNETVDDNCYF